MIVVVVVPRRYLFKSVLGCEQDHFCLLVMQLEHISRQPSTNVSDANIQPGNCCYAFFMITIHERDL